MCKTEIEFSTKVPWNTSRFSVKKLKINGIWWNYNFFNQSRSKREEFLIWKINVRIEFKKFRYIRIFKLLFGQLGFLRVLSSHIWLCTDFHDYKYQYILRKNWLKISSHDEMRRELVKICVHSNRPILTKYVWIDL